MLARGPSRHTVETLRLHWNLPSCSIVSVMKWRMETTGFSGWIPQAIVGKAGMRHRRSGFSGFSESHMVNRALRNSSSKSDEASDRHPHQCPPSRRRVHPEARGHRRQRLRERRTSAMGRGRRAPKTEIYTSAHLSAHRTLIVVLHGDLPTPRPSYQYALAQVVT